MFLQNKPLLMDYFKKIRMPAPTKVTKEYQYEYETALAILKGEEPPQPLEPKTKKTKKNNTQKVHLSEFSKDKNEAEQTTKAKALGRKVLRFDEEVWKKHRFEIVCRGNFAKFSQNSDLGEYLLQTGKKVLVEASPVDAIWGIGMAYDHPDAENPLLWRGLNLLGFALMKVRDDLNNQPF